MQLKQIIVRPSEHEVTVQYTDNLGRIGSLSYDSTDHATVDTLITEATGHLPSEEDRPDRSEIEQEIAELEYRLEQLKASIGQA